MKSTKASKQRTRDRVSHEHIELTPGICGGKARISGTRIRVQDVYVWHELQGRSPDEIVAEFPQLTHADIHAALSYYFDHRDEIQGQMHAQGALVEALKRKYPSKLKQKLKVGNAPASSIPSR
jgi:uncharacterized protein (DUF433 family)